MKLTFTLYVASILLISTAFAQTAPFEKECRLLGGGGFANGFGDVTGGPDIWLQMSYRLSKNFSVATEFENMQFNRLRYNRNRFLDPAHDKERFMDNYASFLIKYHLPIPSNISISAVSGWSYVARHVKYFDFETSPNSIYFIPRVYILDGFSIPFIVEINYPIGKVFQAGIRGKYNLNNENFGTTYSAGLAVSMKL